MAKQVQDALEQTQAQNTQKHFYVTVVTQNGEETIGTRIVDMYHYQTRGWLHSHHWWAIHNGYSVSVFTSTDGEVTEHLERAKFALAECFNKAG